MIEQTYIKGNDAVLEGYSKLHQAKQNNWPVDLAGQS